MLLLVRMSDTVHLRFPQPPVAAPQRPLCQNSGWAHGRERHQRSVLHGRFLSFWLRRFLFFPDIEARRSPDECATRADTLPRDRISKFIVAVGRIRDQLILNGDCWAISGLGENAIPKIRSAPLSSQRHLEQKNHRWVAPNRRDDLYSRNHHHHRV